MRFTRHYPVLEAAEASRSRAEAFGLKSARTVLVYIADRMTIMADTKNVCEDNLSAEYRAFAAMCLAIAKMEAP